MIGQLLPGCLKKKGKNGCVWICFHQVNQKLSFILAKGHSRLQVEDVLSDANNAAEPFYENLKAKMFPTC